MKSAILLFIAVFSLIAIISFYNSNNTLMSDDCSINYLPNNIRLEFAELKNMVRSFDNLENNTLWMLTLFRDVSDYFISNCDYAKEPLNTINGSVVYDIGNYSIFLSVNNNKAIVAIKNSSDISILPRVSMSALTFVGLLNGSFSAFNAYINHNVNITGELLGVSKFGPLVQPIIKIINDGHETKNLDLSYINLSYDKKDYYINEGLTAFIITTIDLVNSSEDILTDNNLASVFNDTKKIFLGKQLFVVLNSSGDIVTLMPTNYKSFKFVNSTVIAFGWGGNIVLFNLKNESFVSLKIPSGTYDIEYNPFRKSFLINDRAEMYYNNITVSFAVLKEYDLNGSLLWEWDSSIYFPFNYTLYNSFNYTDTSPFIEWMHVNSLFWDIYNDAIYLNLRNQNSILKINKTTKEIIYQAGEVGSFSSINKEGETVKSLFYHAHDFNYIGNNHFILFNNDYNFQKINNPGNSGFVEFIINETNKSITEAWSFEPENPNYFFPYSGGTAKRLPDGNTLGIFGNHAIITQNCVPTFITEVNSSGDIVWELILGNNNSSFWINNLVRFYERPLIRINNKNLTNDRAYLNITVWENVNFDYKTSGSIKLFSDDAEIYSQDFYFNSNWQDTELLINTTISSYGKLKLVLKDEGGLKNELLI